MASGPSKPNAPPGARPPPSDAAAALPAGNGGYRTTVAVIIASLIILRLSSLVSLDGVYNMLPSSLISESSVGPQKHCSDRSMLILVLPRSISFLVSLNDVYNMLPSSLNFVGPQHTARMSQPRMEACAL